MEINIFDYMRLLRRNWIIIVGSILAGVLGAAIITALIKPTYTASTQLFVSIQSSGTMADLNQGSLFTQERVQTYVETVTTPAVLKPVVEELNLAETPESLASRVSAEAGTNTVLMKISVKDRSAAQAAEIANAVGDSLTEVVGDLEKPESGKSSPVQISTVMPATKPAEPTSPKLALNLGLGLLIGLGLGIVAALLRQVLDTRIRTEDALRKTTDSPVLGKIANDDSAERKPLITQADSQSPRVESFKQLRTNLQFSQAGGAMRSILFTSSLAEEGKTTTSVNTAISMSDSGQRVLLIEGDLRRPRVAKYLGLEGSVGLTTYLVGQAELEDVLQPWGDNELYILTSGRIPPNPSELLGSNDMQKLIADACKEFDVVIVDGPPLLPVADSAVISRLVGGVVLVVGAHKAKAPEVERALNALKLVDAKVLGVVMNRLPIKGADAYEYTYYRNDDADISAATQTEETIAAIPKQRIFPDIYQHSSAEGSAQETNNAAPIAGTAPDQRIRHSNPGFDLADSDWNDSDVVNSSSKPIIRSPEFESFDDAVNYDSNTQRGTSPVRGSSARHARR